MLFVNKHIIYESVLDDLKPVQSSVRPTIQEDPSLESLTRFHELIVVTAANIHNPDTSQLEQFLESRTDDWQILHINSSDNSVSDFEAFMNFIDIDYDT